jgi:hypothetical protein
MEELRLERRDGDRVIVSNSSGNEFVLVADETLLTEVRSAVRSDRGVRSVNPAEIQRLIREGRSRDEVIDLTGADKEDVERYEGPVLAERNFILNQAYDVPVRTNKNSDQEDDAPQTFGTVLSERLIGINADGVRWSSWKDADAGWLIALEFRSHEVEHKATWSFNHRKRVLAPMNADAVTLSKQADPGDRLIPKLRAVDLAPEAADDQETDVEEESHQQSSPADQQSAEPSNASAGAEAEEEPNSSADYERRRHIDDLAVARSEDEPRDLGETQDLLKELRRRRGERENSQGESPTTDSSKSDANALFAAPGVTGKVEDDGAAAPRSTASTERAAQNKQPRNDQETELDFGDFDDHEREQSGASDASQSAEQDSQPFDAARKAEERDLFAHEGQSQSVRERAEDKTGVPVQSSQESSRQKKRGRAAIPSWDDILFGTRSEDDPA